MTRSPCETCAERGTGEKGGYRWRGGEGGRGGVRRDWRGGRGGVFRGDGVGGGVLGVRWGPR